MKKLAALFAVLAFPALAAESLEKTVVTFSNRATYDFVPFDLLPNGTSIFHITTGGRQVTAESFDGETVTKDADGALGCFEIAYDKTSDLLSCSQRNGYQGWFTNYYHGLGGDLTLMKVMRFDMDDPDTEENEEKTVIEYEAGK